MQHDDLKKMQESAVDLGQSREAAEAAEKARVAAAQKQAESQIKRWDRAMTRAFKGILPAPERRRMLDKAVSRV